MSRSQLTEDLNALAELNTPGDPVELIELLSRLHENWAFGGDVTENVAVDWLRHVKDLPAASIWYAYEFCIANLHRRPPLAVFLSRVKTHAGWIAAVHKHLALAAMSKFESFAVNPIVDHSKRRS